MKKELKSLVGMLLALTLILPVNSTVISRPNTFTNGTVIDATQVNSNENTIYNDYNGSINSTNISANGLAFSNLSTAMQQYWTYRRPCLQYTSTGTVTVETGVLGTSGQVTIIFHDGSIRSDSTSSHILLDMTRTASLSGTKRSGIRSGAIANNTWYAVYMVVATDDSTSMVAVADTVLPIVANNTTLNTNFGSNGWVYLGLIRVGSNGSDTAAGSIIRFIQSGSLTILCGATSNANGSGLGLIVNDTTNNPATYTLTYGTGTTDIPSNISFILIAGFTGVGGASGLGAVSAGDASRVFYAQRSANGIDTVNGFTGQIWTPVTSNSNVTTLSVSATGSGVSKSVSLTGWVDAVLGSGPNPLY